MVDTLRLTRIIRVGGSLAVIIPANLARQMNIERGDQLAVSVFSDNVITLGKLSEQVLSQLRPPIVHA